MIQALTRLPKQLPLKASHCVKSVQIRRFFWSVSSSIRIEYGDLNTDIHEVNLRIQSEYRKIQTRKNSVFGLPYPANNYFFKVNNRSTRKRCEICPKLTIKTPLRRQWRRSSVFIFNLERISHLLLLFRLFYFEQVNVSWVWSRMAASSNLSNCKINEIIWPKERNLFVFVWARKWNLSQNFLPIQLCNCFPKIIKATTTLNHFLTD